MQPSNPTHSQPATAAGRRAEQRNLNRSQLARQPDAVLVARARGGSEAAFAEIVRRYERPLQGYCARVLDAALAKDAVQQTFLRALAALRTETTGDLVLRPWLYRVAHRCALDIRRRDKVTLVELDRSLDEVDQPQQLLELHERLHTMVAAMRKLPASQRRALIARELEGRSYHEISNELDQSDAGVRQLIFRARKALRAGLGAILPLFQLRRLPAHAGDQLTAASSGQATALARGAAVALSAGCMALGIAGVGSGAPRSATTVGKPSTEVARNDGVRLRRVTLIALRTQLPMARRNYPRSRPQPAVRPSTPDPARPVAAEKPDQAPAAAGPPSAPQAAALDAVAVESAAPASAAAQVLPAAYVTPASSGGPAGSPTSAPAVEPAPAPSQTSTAPGDLPAPSSRNPHGGGPPPGHGPQPSSGPKSSGDSAAAPGHSGIARGGSGGNADNHGLHAGQLAQAAGAV